jgi:alpha-beta hydrolase superfamily lysophospholipase
MAESMYQAISSSDKKMILYPGSYHEIYNDLDQDKVFDDTIIWLDEHIKKDPIST